MLGHTLSGASHEKNTLNSIIISIVIGLGCFILGVFLGLGIGIYVNNHEVKQSFNRAGELEAVIENLNTENNDLQVKHAREIELLKELHARELSSQKP